MRVDEQVDGRTYAGSSELTSGEDHQNVFSVTDEDLRGQVTMSLEGADSGAFLLADVVIDGRGGLRVLLFDNAPDYERPADRYGHNVYRVTLVATDSAGAETRRPLTVLVNNVPQGGGMTVKSAGADPLQPEAGQWVHAGLSDADGELAPVTWQWSRGETDTEGAVFETIPGATGPSYMPTGDDGGYYLRVTATYTDSTSEPDDPRTTHLDERVQKLEDGSVTAKTAGESDSPDRLYRVTSTSVNAVRTSGTDDGDPKTPTGFADASHGGRSRRTPRPERWWARRCACATTRMRPPTPYGTSTQGGTSRSTGTGRSGSARCPWAGTPWTRSRRRPLRHRSRQPQIPTSITSGRAPTC